MKPLSYRNNSQARLPSVLNHLLKEPGDSLKANVTKSGLKVVKIKTSEVRISSTQYPNGTMVVTRTYRNG